MSLPRTPALPDQLVTGVYRTLNTFDSPPLYPLATGGLVAGDVCNAPAMQYTTFIPSAAPQAVQPLEPFSDQLDLDGPTHVQVCEKKQLRPVGMCLIVCAQTIIHTPDTGTSSDRT